MPSLEKQTALAWIKDNHRNLSDWNQAEFNERTGGGIGGSKWRAPLLPPDIKPPIHFPWPEYINTVRGEEWWIPTGDEDQ